MQGPLVYPDADGFLVPANTSAGPLAYINTAGNAVIKVDNVTNGAGNDKFGRPSVNILSNATFSAGSLVLMDAVHMPYGVRYVHLVAPFLLITSRFHSAPSGLHSGPKVPTGQMTVKSILLRT